MKLKSKQTGEVMDFDAVLVVKDVIGDEVAHLEYDSIQNLTDQWEDVKESEEDWFVDAGGEVREATYLTDGDKSRLANFGNCFKTKEEAEKTAEKLQAWKRLRDKGFKITLHGYKGSAWLEANWGNLQGDYSDIIFLFGGEE